MCGSPSTEMLAPFDDLDYEIWVLGNRCDKYPRFDRIFEIHDDLSEKPDNYPAWLVSLGKPLVVGEAFPLEGERFPYDAATELLGDLYLTSSSAAMLAYAILKGYDDVSLYGVDMAVDDHEYFWQRPCMEMWVGFAKGRGINVHIPKESPLCRSDYVEGRDYGKVRPDTPTPSNEYAELAKIHSDKIAEIAGQLSELSKVEQQIEQLKLSVTAHDAARQVYERLAKVQRAKESHQNIPLKNTVEVV